MYPSVRFSLIKRIFVFPIHQEGFDDAVRTLVEYQAHWPDVEAAFLGIRRPLHSPPTDRSASYRDGHGSGSPVPKTFRPFDRPLAGYFWRWILKRVSKRRRGRTSKPVVRTKV